MAKTKIKIKRELRRMKQDKRVAYLLKHGNFLIKNASTFVGIPNDGALVKTNAMELVTLLSMQRKGKKGDIAYTDQLDVCFEMMDENYDFVDLVAKGDVKINDKSGLNSRLNNKIRTKRPKTDTGAHWVQEMTPNQLTLETTRDETSRISAVIFSSDDDFKVEMIKGNRIKISFEDKSACIDFSTAAKIIMKYLEGGKEIEAYLIKANSNGLAIPRKMQKITPQVDENYKPVIPPKPPDIPKDESPESSEYLGFGNE